ncbi:MAG: hypothetical protein R2725_02755 [Solirubrobacterales bacterium]
MLRTKRLGLGIAASVTTLALAAVLLAVPSPQARPTSKYPVQLRSLLRLTDLPPGYRVFDGSPESGLGGLWCARVEPADPEPALERFIAGQSPRGCLALFLRSYRVPETGPAPLVVGSGAMRLGSAAAAEEGLDVAPQLISHAIGDELPAEASAAPPVGDRARLFHLPPAYLFSAREEAASFLVWRSGSGLGAIFVAGPDPGANDRSALVFAERQQRHLEQPDPFSPAELDDTEVGLEDPALRVPVYWLGPRSAGGRGLPRLRLQETASIHTRGAGDPQLALFYADHPQRRRYEAVFMRVYSGSQWRRLARKRERLPGVPRCDAAAHPLKLGRGHAVVFSGRERRPAGCKGPGPRTWTLRARLGRAVVIAATAAICETCASAGRGAYNSLRGMKAIARELKLRRR